MERAPFLTATRRYLEDVRAYYRLSTLERKRRNLLAIHRDLESLGVPLSPPSKLREEHVAALLRLWQERPLGRGRKGLDPATQAKLLAALADLLNWLGNPVIERMRKRRHVRFPRAVGDKPIQVLSAEELARLRSAASAIEGWRGSVARFLIGALPYTGLRPKEIRLARLEDLDLDRGRILVSHPKGEGSWGKEDFAPLPPLALPAVEDFLAERVAYLAGEDCEWLIPLRKDNLGLPIGPWSDGPLRKLKADIQERSGVRFRGLKTFRATFAQNAVDHGAPIEAVSRAMRHRTTRTTEQFYARIRAENAFAEINQAFERPVRVRP
jgi:integrase